MTRILTKYTNCFSFTLWKWITGSAWILISWRHDRYPWKSCANSLRKIARTSLSCKQQLNMLSKHFCILNFPTLCIKLSEKYLQIQTMQQRSIEVEILVHIWNYLIWGYSFTDLSADGNDRFSIYSTVFSYCSLLCLHNRLWAMQV